MGNIADEKVQKRTQALAEKKLQQGRAGARYSPRAGDCTGRCCITSQLPLQQPAYIAEANAALHHVRAPLPQGHPLVH